MLFRSASYKHGALAAYAQARPLYGRALAIREKALGPEHPDTAESLNDLAHLLQAEGRARRGPATSELAAKHKIFVSKPSR